MPRPNSTGYPYVISYDTGFTGRYKGKVHGIHPTPYQAACALAEKQGWPAPTPPTDESATAPTSQLLLEWWDRECKSGSISNGHHPQSVLATRFTTATGCRLSARAFASELESVLDQAIERKSVRIDGQVRQCLVLESVHTGRESSDSRVPATNSLESTLDLAVEQWYRSLWTSAFDIGFHSRQALLQRFEASQSSCSPVQSPTLFYQALERCMASAGCAPVLTQHRVDGDKPRGWDFTEEHCPATIRDQYQAACRGLQLKIKQNRAKNLARNPDSYEYKNAILAALEAEEVKHDMPDAGLRLKTKEYIVPGVGSIDPGKFIWTIQDVVREVVERGELPLHTVVAPMVLERLQRG